MMAVIHWVCLFSVLFCHVWTKQVTQNEQEDVLHLPEASDQDYNHPAATQVKIGAFNIQLFGRSKMGKPEVVKILRKILVRYDIVLIQEVRDSTESAIISLLKEVNAEAGKMAFNMVISERLGRTASKEQYAYFYRIGKVQVLAQYQYPDYYDTFERPPFVVKFKAPGTQIGEFGFIGIHAKPTDAVSEVDALVDVYGHMIEQWGIEDFIMGGDFNAGCTYIRKSDWKNIRLRQSRRYSWKIDDNTKTNVSPNKDCPYDRFVLGGPRLMTAFVQGSAGVYRFDRVHKLSLQETLAVSDHYPIDMSVQ